MNKLSSDFDLLTQLDKEQLIELKAPIDGELDHNTIAARMRAVLEDPMDYPGLSLATVPGDRVTIVIAEDVPQIASVVEGALAALHDAGVEQSLITLLFSQQEQIQEEVANKLRELSIDEHQIIIHNPSDEDGIAMFGVANNGEALRLNRVVSDADLVVSIGTATSSTKPTFNGLYPEFSDQQTITRFDAEGFDQESADATTQEAQEAGWMLGVGMIVQVVCAPEGGIAEIFAGDPGKVTQIAKEANDKQWKVEYSSEVDLVIASLGTEPNEQTWENLAKALNAASALLKPKGSIVLCSTVSETPAEALHLLAGCEDFQLAEREIQKNKLPGSSVAWQFCKALDQCPVYLCSQLPENFIEGLGISPVVSVEELERLVENHDSAVLLHEAHKILPALAD